MLTKARRTHTCGALGAQDIGSRVVLQGWADGVRNLGGVTFVDLRDRHGVTQVTIDERSPEETRAVGAQAHLEYVLEVEGTVVARANPNPRIPTGAIELIAERATILSRTPALPFAIREEPNTSEETRLRYRYLDLRRTQIQKNLVIRHRMALATRRYLDSEGFIEVETPILTKATPEGARDYLVPSRVHPGHWYALPQSPQIFKQILMIAGMDRYFQIVKCFRDEDLRADRQPEFTQIDLELSFATRELVMEVAEGVARTLWREVLGYEIPPIERLSYADSIARFGLDAPDLRFGMELFDLTDALRETGFALIGGALGQGGICKGLCVQGAAEDTSRKVIDNWSAWVKRYKLGGVLWGKLGAEGWSGAVAKLSPQEQASVAEISGAKIGDLLILGVGPASAVNPGLGRLRVQIANERKLIPAGFRFCWITDFPAFEWDDQEQRWSAVHHPFTSPRPAHIPLLGTGREGEILADAYDIVCNGYEIGGGSIRIHEPEVQRKVFTALGMSAETVASKFGYLIEALQYGAPPHGGLAFGFDRCAMLLCGTDNIREVIAFPKTTAAQDLMSDAPSGVDPKQLVELHVRNVTE